jgi:hypothetical protein
MSQRELTAQQELFLEYLFNDTECANDTQRAAEKAGYIRQSHANLVRTMKDEIVKRAEEQLALQAPKAVAKLIKSMDEDGSTPRGDIRLKAVESVLDRIGVAKKQQMEVSTSDATPIFFIPAKAAINESE